MINKLIKEQLDKVKEAKIDEYDSLHHTFHIKKYKEKTFEYNVLYIVRLDDHLLNATDNVALVSNWNNGKYPTHKYLKFAVNKKLAKMINVYGVYYDIDGDCDLSEDFEGWLPVEQLEIIKETKL